MTNKLDKAESRPGGSPTGIEFLLLLTWVGSAVVAAQLCVRSEARFWPSIAAFVFAASLALWLWLLLRASRSSGNVTEREFGRFTLRNTLLILGYVLGLVLAMYWLDRVTHPLLRVGLIALPSLALAGWAWAFGAMIHTSDEMMRELRIRAVAVAAGAVLVLATIWGLFAKLLGLPEFPGFLLLPGFALVYGASLQIIGGTDA